MKPTELSILNFQSSCKRAQRKLAFDLYVDEMMPSFELTLLGGTTPKTGHAVIHNVYLFLLYSDSIIRIFTNFAASTICR